MSRAVKIHQTHTSWEIGFLFVLGILFSQTPAALGQKHYGVKIGPLDSIQHNVGGMLYAADATHLILDEFTYDGQGQDTYYWVGTTDFIGVQGGTPIEFDPYPQDGVPIKIPQNVPHTEGLIRMRLPKGMKVTDYKYFSIYCRNALADFGSIKFPPDLRMPEPRTLLPLKPEGGVTSVKSREVVIIDLTTMIIKAFSFDGGIPGAVFRVGTKDAVAEGNGVGVQIKGERDQVLRRFNNEDITLTIDEMEFPDFEIIGVYDGQLKPLATLELPKDLENLPVHFDIDPLRPGPGPGPTGPDPLNTNKNNTNGSATRNAPISNYIGFYSYMTATLLAVGFMGLLQYA